MSKGDSLKFCGNCGQHLDESAQFCGSCGAPSSEEAIQEDQSLQKDYQLLDNENSFEDQGSDHEQGYPYPLYPEVDIESDDSAVIPPVQRRKGVLWGTVLVTVLLGGLILAKVNNSENSAFLASVSHPTNTDSSTSPQPEKSPSSEPKATKSPMTNSPKPTPKASPRKIDQCAISDRTVSDIVAFKNLIQVVPAGRNDASHKGTILQWVDSAIANADAIRSDASSARGNIVGAMVKSGDDLSTLASLAQDWANNNLSDPGTFPTQYGNAASAVRTDYSSMSAICGNKLP